LLRKYIEVDALVYHYHQDIDICFDVQLEASRSRENIENIFQAR